MTEFGWAIEQEIPRLRRYARALTRDPTSADDLVQNCLTRALAKQHLWMPGTDLRAWLFTILHNTRINDLRRSTREAAGVEMAIMVTTPAHRDPDAGLELRDLDRAIAELPEDYRRVLLLVGLEGASYPQAAAILGIPVGTVRSRMARARERLRTQVGRSLSRRPRTCRLAQAA